MITLFFARYQRQVALSFLLVMYLEMALPIHAAARALVYTPVAAYLAGTGATTILKRNNRGFEASEPEKLLRTPLGMPRSTPIKLAFNPAKRFSSGPTQPEMQSFQSVNSNNMVDLFTGDFSYNIPLLDVGGYPVNIHYSSGITMDQEASWVGLGWNINPGTITRNMRGLPDDFNGTDRVEKTLSLKKNKTIGVTAGVNIEVLGQSVSLGASLGVFHNNYKGWGTETGINAGINSGGNASGAMTLGLGVNNNSQNGLDISPSLSFKIGSENDKAIGNVSIGTNYNSRTGINSLQMTGQISQQKTAENNGAKVGGSASVASLNAGITFSKPAFTPTITIPFTSSQYSFKVKLGSEAMILHPNASVRGYGSVQKIAPEDRTQSLPAYGYLFFQEAKGNQNALLDFNREKEIAFREKEPHIAVPMYTYDSYCINGEGTGGMFRPYRGDIGFIYDHAMSSKSNSNSFSLDLGFGTWFHGGLDYDGIFADTKNKPWLGDNILKDVIPFKKSDSTYESVYFKNPGEKTSVDQSYYNAIGDTRLMRVDLNPLNQQSVPTVTATRRLSTFSNSLATGKITLSNNVFRKTRDKRTQVISYLNAEEARSVGLDRVIRSYNINSFPTIACNTNYTLVDRVDRPQLDVKDQIRKPHHLSEVTVLNNDGRRYIYGIPAYNFSQREVSFSVDQQLAGRKAFNALTGQIGYNEDKDNSVNNDKGIDNYFNRELMPSYAHSFLLSGILSPDYSDITGDGISEDDPGEAIKFNYSRIYDYYNRYTWRAPFDSAAYNEGLKTDNRDEKASYSYGEREVWYLNSVESKSMMATFVLDVGNPRLDGYGVAGENGHLDRTKKSYRLKEINLYAKADYIKNGMAAAKPIKTVHFDYSYELCKKNPSSVQDSGKLTLKRIWFTYNKNEKRPLNPYVFTYHANNPSYLKGATDRWGNYKDSRSNPAQLSNADYPYSLQSGGSNNWDSTKAAANAAAWTLSKIKLPSGGELRVTYESDDYAYVQNKRAMQMFTIAGFGSDPSATPSASVYPQNGRGADYQYAFINVNDAVSNKQEIQRKYLDGVERLYFKLFVQVPGDRWGKGGEYVPFYADIDGNNYGVKGTGASKVIWIKLATLPDGAPPAVASTQFLRLNLPSKAYPMSEPGDDVDAVDFIKMILTAAGNVTDAVKGFGAHARSQNQCNAITVSQSFVRLNNPSFKKLGGGLRVKKIEVFDNFRAMTKGQQQDATYGQQYEYSTTAMINNIPTRISSGVAAYEPAIGGEENPFHVPVDYTEKIAPLTPTNYKYTEEPLGETYFPGPMVGYSKVSVQSINNKQKSATGIEQTEFYTTYDFPTVWEFTPLDNESKKTYNPPIQNFFKFFARHEVTLSQGFKVELNDMNGKMKSQSSFAQTDLVNPISYTYNYYNVDKEATLRKQLSATVPVIDSANGRVNNNGQLGKDIEVMIDLREQTSRTINGSVESNIDIVPAGPFPLILPSLIPIGSSETNRFRSVAVMKVVNRYGILDSVVHMENGSIVSTKNMVYDGVTGDVLLSRTNNEFDDPIYNFSYPAHWAYTGMGPASRNIGASWQQVNFRQGKMYIGATQFNTDNNFESGDELLVRSADIRVPLENDTCNAAFYTYTGQPTTKRIWAIEAAKGREGHKGIYFIDKNGIPFSATGAYIKILRSGKRNMMGTPVGAVTSLANPLRTSSGITSIVFDAASQAVNASAAQFKDFWRVDSLTYKKDTTITVARLADSVVNRAFNVNEIYTMQRKAGSGSPQHFEDYNGAIRTLSQDNGGRSSLAFYNKTWMRFDITTDPSDPVPGNSVITKANLYLYNNDVTAAIEPHANLRGPTASNQGYLRQVRGQWIRSYLQLFPDQRSYVFEETGQGLTNPSVQSIIKPTPAGILFRRNDTINITPQVQGMVNDYYSSLGTSNIVANALVLGLTNNAGANNGTQNRLSYNITGTMAGHSIRNQAFAEVSYCKPCASGSKPYYSNTPERGYYCNDLPKDTFVCKPNIVDSAVNPYRWGILGNWRMVRAYTYYDKRKDSVPTIETNIRKDGQIFSFAPYWSFTNNMMRASTDTNRWVWNSEMTLFNRKGYEIENKDPLNRYNGGQYGYNQTLPVAVGQNTHNREMMFDGFEDYGYSTDACIGCAVPRFIGLANNPATLVDNVSHSGQYSLRVNGNQTTSTVVKIATQAEDATDAYMSLRIDTMRRIKTIVNGNGGGLTGKFYKSSSSTTPCVTLTGEINYNWGNGSGPGGSCGIDNFNGVWTGKIQPRYTDNYIFYSNHDDGIKITVNGVLLMSKPSPSASGDSSSVIALQAGKLYSIKVEYTEVNDLAYVNLKWRSKGGDQSLEVVPRSLLYNDAATDASVASTLTYDTTYCVYARSPKGKRLTNDRFSPLQGSRMVVSAWVKEEQPCVSGSYQNSQMVLNFNTSTPTVVTLKPTGKIIEGWQRVEAFVDIPSSATSMTVSMQATNASIPVYFDDVRMHPFNSNIKSFVYNPVNLRLMAELDENNYATFYEYDDDGTLIRLKKETERGIKTIKETRTALLKE